LFQIYIGKGGGMESTNLDFNKTVELEDDQELEPMLLAQVTEVTRGAFGFMDMDGDNIVWGYPRN
jgi:hypothetical protein